MKYIEAFWFHGLQGSMGIVVGEDEVTKEKKAYIGVSKGVDEDADIRTITTTGAKVLVSEVEKLLNHLKPQTLGCECKNGKFTGGCHAQ